MPARDAFRAMRVLMRRGTSGDRIMAETIEIRRCTICTPEDVARGITEGRMLLVDVREPNETEVERYPDAVDRAAVEFRSRADSRSAGQAGGVCLPLRQALGDRVAGGAGRGLAIRRASRRRHPGLEGAGLADRELIAELRCDAG